MEREIKFSFLKLFNNMKGIHKPATDADPEYLEKRADKNTRDKFQRFFRWCDDNGIEHPKLKYPVYFGSGDAKYPGMMATDDIGKDEIMIKVPAKMVFSTKICFQGDISRVFYEHPELFGKHVGDGEDNVLNTFILYELGKGEKSFWKPMFDIWPRETDILMNWDYEDIEWLQDDTLEGDANNQYQDFLSSWNALYKCLTQYPEYFSEESIGLYRYKWVYMLTTNRCFGSNWPGVCAMIPYAELINHENVDVQYDYLDKQGKSITCRREERKKEEKEERLLQLLKKKLFLEDLKEDLEKMEVELRSKLNGEEVKEQSQEDLDQQILKKEERRQQLEFQLRAKLANGQNKKGSSDEEDSSEQSSEEEKGKEGAGAADDYDYSSGIESDNDVDLLVEQEVLQAIKLRKEQQRREDEEKKKRGEMPGEEKIVLTNEQAHKIWQMTINNVPDEYDFVIRTYNEGFPKGSQVYLCYGRMSNREMLKRYGFCLQKNKYNYLYIKLRLEQNDPEFQYRKFVLRKFFSVDPTSDKMDISSRHFRIYFQKLNTKVLKFIKILTFNIREDDISCIVETRSLSLEYISLQKLRTVYEQFLEGFPTTLQEDNRIMKEDMAKLNGRKFFALFYRSEMKKILINQINLIKILLHILERIMKGMTLEFAVTRVFELESKKEFVINRMMIDNYLTSLKKGLEKNQQEYLQSKGITSDKLLSQQRDLRIELPKVAYRQFEIKGYDKMIERILEAPIKSSQQRQNKDLEQKLMLIKGQLEEQVKYQKEVLKEIEDQQIKVVSKKDDSDSSYESYYDEENDEKDEVNVDQVFKQQQVEEESKEEEQAQQVVEEPTATTVKE